MRKIALFASVAALVVAFAGAKISGEKTAAIMPDEPAIHASIIVSL
jgi:hypothetical protein